MPSAKLIQKLKPALQNPLPPEQDGILLCLDSDSGTGNFVKSAQRIAVKIVFDAGQQDLERLAPGMSAEVNIATK